MILRFPADPTRPQTFVARGTIVDPTNALVVDPTVSDIDVTVWEDRNTVLFRRHDG